MPDNEAEDHTFIAYLVCGSGSYTDRLRVHHLAHDTPGTVGGGHQDVTQTQLLRSDLLQAAEQSIRRCVTASKGHTQPRA